jgi:curved DNA-binding protein CbpA
MQNYYEILEVNENASQEQIKKAFRKASLKKHPDRGGNKEEFQKINTAYQILGDPEKKRKYDMERKNPFMRNNGGFNINHNRPDEIFKMFFGGQGGMPFKMGDLLILMR